MELYEGVTRTRTPEAEREAVLTVLDSKTVVPADQVVMRRAGELSSDLITDGQRTNREDCIVAAKAFGEEEPVLTRKTTHFDRISGLEVVS